MKTLIKSVSLLVTSLFHSVVCGQPLQFDFVAEANVGGHPESVIGDQDFLYASNFGPGAASMAKDGNGYISKIAYDGTVMDQSFITLAGGLDAPTGMALLNNRLFVADVDEVIGFDLDGQAAPQRISLTRYGVSFLNDLVAVSDHQLVVSGTNVKRLFLIDTLAGSATPLQLDFALDSPNGLAFAQSTGNLYVAANKQHTIGANVSNGEILKLHLDVAAGSASFVAQASNAGLFLDGIALLGNNELIYSDWVSFSSSNGVLRRLDLNGLTPLEPSNLNLKGFADFHWQADRRILATPNLVDGRVRLLSLPVPEPATWGLLLVTASVLGLVGRR